ncbi:sulfatase-like hydrolase/transferase [Haloplanus pelagicus]|jgi:arylsulfatase A-like enzyme|uniref:sulfatase-like hydrolase/transferase n=1 Tax=Haloplanus pelagicus TaxID=2949995 RepID=UPI0020404D4C|nr:sulfatase-like hydrolase/transferase [Haloplanus sp. HW8-1]
MTDTPASNVLLVTVDSLRADAIEPYGGEYDTPTFSAVAERGTVFENAFAHGNWTPMSFPSILASRPVFADTGRIGVDDVTSLAERVGAAGVATGGFNAANGFLTEHWGYDRGFDVFETFVGGSADGRAGEFVAAHPTWGAWLQLLTSPFRRAGSFLRGGDDERPFTDASRMLDVERGATSFVEETDEPFFLWVHYMDAHTPYVPAPRYLRDVTDRRVGKGRMLIAHVRTGLGWSVGDRTLDDLRTLYQGAVRQVDASLGRLLSSLDDAGVADDTAVVVAGDHGEEFMEHGHLAHYPKLYDELVHVPLLIDVPGLPARRVADHVGLDAIAPTVCDLLGVAPAAEWTGKSLLPTIRDGARPSDEPVVTVTVRGDDVTQQPIPRSLDEGDLLVSARDSDWVYIRNTETDAEELYDRRADPGLQDDRSADDDPTTVAARDRLREATLDHAATLDAVDHEAHEGDVGDDIETRLEALGYR